MHCVVRIIFGNVKCQVLIDVRLGKPVYAVDTAQNGRLVALGGAGSKMLLNVLS